jgi:hypothetical protein
MLLMTAVEWLLYIVQLERGQAVTTDGTKAREGRRRRRRRNRHRLIVAVAAARDVGATATFYSEM